MTAYELLLRLNKKVITLQRQMCCVGGGLSFVTTEDSATVTWTGTGTADDPLIATAVGGGTLTDANNGLSLNGTNVVLGQDLTQLGDPAFFSSHRELPTNSFNLYVSGGGSLILNSLLDTGEIFQLTGQARLNLSANSTILTSSGNAALTATGNAPAGNYRFAIQNMSATGDTSLFLNNDNGESLQLFLQGTGNSGYGLIRYTGTNAFRFNTQNTATSFLWGTNTYPLFDTIMSLSGTGQLALSASAPVASAKLQVDSTTQGVLFPRMTTTQRDAILTPATGLMIYNTTTNKANVYNGTAWVTFDLGDVVGPASATDNAIVRFDLTTGKLIQDSLVTIDDAGKIGVGITPTAFLHIKAGTATAGTAQIKLAPSVILTTPEVGAIENEGDLLYHTISTGTARKILPSIPTASLVVDRVAFYSAAGLESSNGLRYNTGSASLGISATPTSSAYLIIGAGGTSRVPIRLTSGVVLTTASVGSIEYNGTNLFFTRVGTTRENILTGVDAATAPATSIGAAITNYYGLAATNFLGDPNSWASVVINGTTYKVPLYT